VMGALNGCLRRQALPVGGWGCGARGRGPGEVVAGRKPCHVISPVLRGRGRVSRKLYCGGGVVTMDGQQAARRPRRVEGLQAVPGCGGVAGAAWAQPPMFFCQPFLRDNPCFCSPVLQHGSRSLFLLRVFWCSKKNQRAE